MAYDADMIIKTQVFLRKIINLKEGIFGKLSFLKKRR